ncbi:sulfite exporter TauE/SafE family protein [Microbacterium sp. MYb62]|uniref:sulfite exporter TauE/SafE family protein n=1 Tax=Microbacterium sp. MYb62 TaxID=1848690 RepID=UPI0021585771|nr:sulfite exporter TauE/SafE family protein [Microbacterium sp. MYb62]
MPESAQHREPRAYVAFVGIGLAAGLLSGMFGVGGGAVIVPLLVLLAGFDQRRAAGTSLAAIVPTAGIGVISYATLGQVAWVPAVILAAGAIVGAQIGARLLPKVSQTVLRWGFVGFLLAVIVSLFLLVPSRDAVFEIGWLNALALVGLGLGTGVVSGLIGVGGGIIVVPFLMFVFGASDLTAKGTSLLMMIPAALSGTFGNLRTGNVELVPAVIIGAAACTTTALGAWFATLVDPGTANALFAVFLVVIATQMAIKAVRGRRSR